MSPRSTRSWRPCFSKVISAKIVTGRAEQLGREHRLIAEDDTGSLEPAYALEARARRQPDALRQFLDGGATVTLERGEDLDVDPIQ